MVTDAAHPRLTVITPSFNQAAFLPATLQSVADQDYPNIEHLVLDGGSTDGSVEILRSWSAHPITWRSQPDGGQAAAINDGVAMATGDVIAWLNSDDVYLGSGVASAMMAAIADADAVTGAGRYLSADGVVGDRIPVRPDRLSRGHVRHVDWLLQPATFVRASLMRRFPLDPTLYWAMDWDLFIRIADLTRFVAVDVEVAGYRLHDTGKTVAGGGPRKRELLRVVERHHGRWSPEALAMRPVIVAYWCSDRLPHLPGGALRKLAWWWCRLTNVATGDRGVPY